MVDAFATGGQFMSRLVLGGASLGKIPQSDVDFLLHTALECGIRKIDTAPGYGDSEKRIGKYLKGQDLFSINSKVGLPDPSLFTPAGIRNSVENSLRDLGIEQIETLFVHSLSKMYLTEDNIATLVHLKEEGKILKVGYSGDGENLNAAVQIESFDDFMMTFNIIDQSNLDKLEQLSRQNGIYFKMPLAQAIWTGFRIDRRVASLTLLRKLLNKPPLPDTWLDYKMRFEIFRDRLSSRDYVKEFLGFALFYGRATQRVVLGTISPQHLRDAVCIESEPPKGGQVYDYASLWAEAGSADWEAHN